MKNFNVYDPMKRGEGLVLDGQTLAHIEILQNSEGTEEGSLLKLLCRCITPSGKYISLLSTTSTDSLRQANVFSEFGFVCLCVSWQISMLGKSLP